MHDEGVGTYFHLRFDSLPRNQFTKTAYAFLSHLSLFAKKKCRNGGKWKSTPVVVIAKCFRLPPLTLTFRMNS